MQFRFSKWWRVASLLLLCLVLALVAISRKYVWLYATRKHGPAKASDDIIRDPRSSGNPEILLAEANRLAWLSNWPKAEPLYVRAEELFRENGNTRNEVYARVGRIRARSEQMSWVDVSKMLGQQLELPVAKSDQQLRLWCLVAKGYTDLDLNPVSARRAWTEAKTIAHQLGEVQWEARAKGELGIIGFLEGDSRGAAMMVGDSLLSAMASGDEAGQVRMLEMLGNGFNEGKRYDEALAFFDRAIKTSSATSDAGFPFTAYEGEAYALLGEGKVSEAKNTLDRALRAARESQKLGHESMILQLLGELEMRTGDRQVATNYLEQACKIAEKFEFYRMLGQSMIDLAELYRDDGDLKSAETHAAIGVNASRRVGDRYYLPRDLSILADLEDRQGATDKAEALYENAEDVIDGMLVNVHEAYWTSSLAGAMSDIYVRHFELEARRGDMERALSVLERVRGRTVATLLQNKQSFGGGESMEAQLLEDSVSDLQLRLMRSEDAKERVGLLDQLMEYERRLEWTRTKEEPDSRWFDRPVSIREIQAVLRPKEIVLEYVLSEPKSYCFWISRDRAGVQVLSAGRKEIGALAESYLSATRARRDNRSAASQLHDILLGQLPAEADGERIIVVPDGVLHLLPFDTLRDSSGTLVLEAHTVSYIPAATVLRVLRKEKPMGTRKHALLGVGDVAYQNQGHVSARLAKPLGIGLRLERRLSDTLGTAVYDLPQTREEVLAVSRILGNDSVLLVGHDATETEFKSTPLTEFKIVHIAAHGFADTRFPERSGLVLGLDPASHDDGLLQVREIMRLRFNADLVTLSACNTGVGKLEGEEGVTNLVEAFLVSGAKSVVASLWSADDTYTLDLMERFYTHISEGQDRAAALRQAKLDLLAKFGKQVPPYYWGAFVLVGDGGSPISLTAQ